MADARTLEIILKAKDDASRVVEGANKSMGLSFGKIAKWAGAAAGAFAGLAVIKKGVGFLKEAELAARDSAEKLAALWAVMENQGKGSDAMKKSMETYIDATRIAVGATEEELIPNLAILQAATGDVAKAQDDMNLALDIAKARNISVTTVTLALSKARTGVVTGLQRMGIATKDAAGKALPLEAIIGKLKDTYSGTAAKIAAVDPWGQLAQGWDIAKEKLGVGLMPLVSKFGDLMLSKMPMIGDVMSSVGSAIGEAIGYVFDLFNAVWPYLEALIKGFADFLKGPSGKGAIKGTIEGIGVAAKVLQTVFQAVWPALKSLLGVFAGWMNSPAFKGMVQAVMGALTEAVKAVKAVWDLVWPALGPILKVALKVVTALITGISWTIKGVATALTFVINAFREFPANIKRVFVGAGKWLAAAGKAILTGLKDGVMWVWDHVLKPYFNLYKKILGLIATPAKWLLGVGKDIIVGLWNGIKGGVTWLGDKIMSIGSSVKGFFKKALGISSPSKMTRDLGAFIPQGLALGIEDNLHLVRRAVGAMSTAVGAGTFSPSFAFGGAGAGSAGRTGGNVVHEHRIYLDGKELSRALGRTIVHQSRSGAA